MSAQTIRLNRIVRTTSDGEEESLDFAPGVNVVVGLKDTGKTAWLHMISFALGDTDAPEKALGPMLATKYVAMRLETTLSGGNGVVFERRWTEPGARSKIFINGEAIGAGEFSAWLGRTLGMPDVRFPRGNPYSGATWPELSWRMLFRHVYREERFWSDLADKQPEREQHACLLQFLGVAQRLYPSELGEEIKQRDKLLRLRARKEQFEDVLQQAAYGIVADPSIAVAATRDSIALAIQRLRVEIEQLHRERAVLMRDGMAPPDVPQRDLLLAEKRRELASVREALVAQHREAESRLSQLGSQKATVKTEVARLSRVTVATEAFRPFHVTRCPNCDQRVAPTRNDQGACFVCHQSIPDDAVVDARAISPRISFEQEQLRGEDEELSSLIERLTSERDAAAAAIKNCDAALRAIDVRLAPTRAAVAALLPPGLSAFDAAIGQAQERIAQLERLGDVIGQRDELSRQIDELASSVQTVSGEVDEKAANIPFEQLADRISDGINEYLSLLNQGDPTRWSHKPVRLRLNERAHRLLVGDAPWSTVGATSMGLVLLGYHYSLLKLSGKDECNYPGFVLIDFPMTLADGASIANKENYLVEPFVALASSRKELQVIVCGRAFRSLKGARRLPLDRVWTQGEWTVPPADGDGATGTEEPTES